MHTRTDRMAKNKRKMVFNKQLRQTYLRDANVDRRLARNRDLYRRAQGRTRWFARYADVYDGQGNIISSRYMGHHIVTR